MRLRELRLDATGYRVAVISDTHLTGRLEPFKQKVLEGILSQVDRVVLNGDFWDGFQVGFDDFSHSPWGPVFSQLREKQAVYLFGNHDPWQIADYKVFSADQADRLILSQGKTRFIIEHGHRIAPFLDERLPVPRLILGIGTGIRGAIIAMFGKRFLSIHKRDNERMKAWKAAHMPLHEWLVCGHTHWPEVSQAHRYANSGLIANGHFSYLVIENGEVILKGSLADTQQ